MGFLRPSDPRIKLSMSSHGKPRQGIPWMTVVRGLTQPGGRRLTTPGLQRPRGHRLMKDGLRAASTMDDFRYQLGGRVLVRQTGEVGTVVARQPARVYKVAVPGREQPLFYAESQLKEARERPVPVL